MGILQKLKKLGSFHLAPPRNGRNQRRDEAVPPNVRYGPLPRSFFSAVNLAREDAGYDPLPVNPRRRPIHRGEEHFMNQNPRPEFGAFDRSRPASQERWFDRNTRHGSSDNFHNHLPGTPVKYRRRPISPGLLQPSASSPFLFGQHSLPGSPEMTRHFQHEQQQQQQFDMMMPHPAQFYPQFQQPFNPMMNPNANIQPWFMMPQQQMYPFY